MRRTRSSVALGCVAFMLGGAVAAADSHVGTQTVTVTVEDAPLQLTLTQSEVSFSLTSGEVIPDDGSAMNFKQQTGGVLTVTTPSAAGLQYRIGYARTAGGDSLSEGDGSLSLQPVTGDFPTGLLGIAGQFAPSSAFGLSDIVEDLMVNNIPPSIDAVEIPLLWRLRGTAPADPVTITNTFTFTIAQQ